MGAWQAKILAFLSKSAYLLDRKTLLVEKDENA